MALDLDTIEHLLREHGARQYGREAVSQLDHALQCAYLAEQAGEDDSLVAACLLHDLGHLITVERTQAAVADAAPAVDDLHQYSVLPFLRGLLPEAVLEPIRLHVDAKRYLCQAEPGYFETLSPASVHSLALQGGPFTAAQAQAFAQQPHAAAAVRLRRYDDQAKTPGAPTPPLAHFRACLQRVATAQPAGSAVLA